MKVVCKNNQKGSIDSEDNFENSVIDYPEHLIIDKVYEVLDTDVMDFNNPQEIYYKIQNEYNRMFWYSSNRFITIDQSRNNKLNELGI
jgi:thymidylate kinase